MTAAGGAPCAGVSVGAGTGVSVGGGVAVTTGVFVRVAGIVLVDVAVGVLVAVLVDVGVDVGVLVGVDVFVAVGVFVGVGVSSGPLESAIWSKYTASPGAVACVISAIFMLSSVVMLAMLPLKGSQPPFAVSTPLGCATAPVEQALSVYTVTSIDAVCVPLPLGVILYEPAIW